MDKSYEQQTLKELIDYRLRLVGTMENLRDFMNDPQDLIDTAKADIALIDKTIAIIEGIS